MNDRRVDPCGSSSWGGPRLLRVGRPASWALAESSGADVAIHLVLRGTSRLEQAGVPARQLDVGDVLLLRGAPADAGGDRHADADAFASETLVACYPLQGFGAPEWLAALPGVLHLRSDSAGVDGNVASLAGLIREELACESPGSRLFICRLFDALLVAIARSSAPRAFAVQAPPTDPRIARTLTVLQERLSEKWTIARMAKVAGMSRAAFVRRFTEVTGAAPLTYLTRMRMHLAEALLIQTDEPAAVIAPRVGYQSVYAFGRAFKRWTGHPPVVYRRSERRSIPAVRCGATRLRLAA